jgi:hypothetical protein
MAPKSKGKPDLSDDEEMEDKVPAAGIDEDDSSDDDDSDDDESEEEEQVEPTPAQLNQLQALQSELEANPTAYEKHVEVRPNKPFPWRWALHCMLIVSGFSVDLLLLTWHLDAPQLINLLRELKLKTQLRRARERMAAMFPLNENIWLDWVADELEQVHGRPWEVFHYLPGMYAQASAPTLILLHHLEVSGIYQPGIRSSPVRHLSRRKGIVLSLNTALTCQLPADPQA